MTDDTESSRYVKWNSSIPLYYLDESGFRKWILMMEVDFLYHLSPTSMLFSASSSDRDTP